MNREKRGEWPVATAWTFYSASAPLSGDDQIDVVLTNGGECDLFVDYVEATESGNPVWHVEMEGGSTIRDKGTLPGSRSRQA
ncbi:MAG: hypothetical protein PVG11_07170 [Anaerolineae bacterium]